MLYMLTIGVIDLLLYECEMCAREVLFCMCVEFAIRWSSGGCDSVCLDLVVNAISTFCVFHCVVFLVVEVFVFVRFLWPL